MHLYFWIFHLCSCRWVEDKRFYFLAYLLYIYCCFFLFKECERMNKNKSFYPHWSIRIKKTQKYLIKCRCCDSLCDYLFPLKGRESPAKHTLFWGMWSLYPKTDDHNTSVPLSCFRWNGKGGWSCSIFHSLNTLWDSLRTTVGGSE